MQLPDPGHPVPAQQVPGSCSAAGEQGVLFAGNVLEPG
jgi:hypothetical protein